MKLTLKRIALRPTYTIGKLYIDDVYFCDTIEDTVRDLNKNGKFDNGEKKIHSKRQYLTELMRSSGHIHLGLRSIHHS